MTERVISDTSPLFYLHLVGQLSLLPQLYGTVIVPPAVVAELQAGADQGLPVAKLDELDWIVVQAVQVPPEIQAVGDLGAGEAEVLALALEITGAVILDDGRARQVALVHQIPVIGSGGVLLAAKRLGLLDHVGPLLQAMIDAGFWLSASVRQRLLRQAGEDSS